MYTMFMIRTYLLSYSAVPAIFVIIFPFRAFMVISYSSFEMLCRVFFQVTKWLEHHNQLETSALCVY